MKRDRKTRSGDDDPGFDIPLPGIGDALRDKKTRPGAILLLVVVGLIGLAVQCDSEESKVTRAPASETPSYRAPPDRGSKAITEQSAAPSSSRSEPARSPDREVNAYAYYNVGRVSSISPEFNLLVIELMSENAAVEIQVGENVFLTSGAEPTSNSLAAIVAKISGSKASLKPTSALSNFEVGMSVWSARRID